MNQRGLVVVTGGTGGLGRAVVADLVNTYDVALLFREPKAFDELRDAHGSAITGLRTELTDDVAVAEALERLVATRRLSGAVLMAGGFAAGKIESTSVQSLRALLDMNFVGAFVVLRHLIPLLRRHRGRVVLVSSAAVQQRDSAIAAYTLSKAALNTLAELTADELKGSGATVNVIMPTAMATPEMLASTTPETLVPLSEVVAAVRFLLEASTHSVNGSSLVLSR